MAVDTFVAYIGVYLRVEDAEADYRLSELERGVTCSCG